MLKILQVLTVILVAVAMALALAHALELPGKMRLSKEQYYAMQPIYYPGFTIGGGVGEVGGTISTLVLLLFTPYGSTDFWLTFGALIGLVAIQAVYWLFTHPVNKFWLEGEQLDKFSAGFFSFGTNSSRLGNENHPPDWTQLRDRWEFSHVVRAVVSLLSLIMLVVAVTDAE